MYSRSQCMWNWFSFKFSRTIHWHMWFSWYEMLPQTTSRRCSKLCHKKLSGSNNVRRVSPRKWMPQQFRLFPSKWSMHQIRNRNRKRCRCSGSLQDLQLSNLPSFYKMYLSENSPCFFSWFFHFACSTCEQILQHSNVHHCRRLLWQWQWCILYIRYDFNSIQHMQMFKFSTIQYLRLLYSKGELCERKHHFPYFNWTHCAR